ncbi:MAG: cytochrome c [Gemmatimonadota bacterium]|nr:cytochrome c [Gemmatimonadota bacterium]
MTVRARFRFCMVCTAAALTLAGCSEHIGKGWDWNRMRVQQKYVPYRGSRFFANGMAMQAPPAGSISRESAVGALAVAPLGLSPAALQRGAAQFHIYCAVCHGERGDGDSYVGKSMDPPRPPSLIVPPVSLIPASVVAAIVSAGLGQMPSFSADLSPGDREAVAAYVKSLQSSSASIDSPAHTPARSQ